MEYGTDFMLFDGKRYKLIGRHELAIRRCNGLFHVYIDGVNVVTYSIYGEALAFVDGVEETEKRTKYV